MICQCLREFIPRVHNQKYCSQQCKREMENIRRQTVRTEEQLYDEETWQAQETKKLLRAEENKAKNQWILENKSFATFDLETSNLNASIGEILCGCVKHLNGDTKTFVAGRNGDGLIADRIRAELMKHDYIVTWYGTGFDLPFLQTRLLVSGHKPLSHIRHVDLYYTARSQLAMHSNRQQAVGEALLGESNKTRLIGSVWNAAMKGSKPAMKYIVDHCVKDCEELERIFGYLVKFRNLGATPLRVY